jgi:hypothetical protein
VRSHDDAPGFEIKRLSRRKKQLEKMGQSKSSLLKNIAIFMSVKSPLGLVLFCYFNMPGIHDLEILPIPAEYIAK